MKLLLAKSLRYKIIYTVHNISVRNDEDRRLDKNISYLYKMADLLIAMGEKEKKELGSKINKEIIVIRHFNFTGVYSNRINKECAKSKLGIPENRYVYLSFGSIRSYKGIDFLISCFRGINLDATLLIVGKSTDKQYLDKLYDLLRDDPRIIIIPNEIKDEEIQIYMNASDVVVFPFSEITNSGSWILAKSFYKPTICMDKGNLSEYFNSETDIMTANKEEFREAMIKVFHSKFNAERNSYIKGIPSVDEVALLYKNIYKKISNNL